LHKFTRNETGASNLHSSGLVKTLLVLSCLLSCSAFAAEPDQTVDVDALLRSANEWARQNLNDDALRVLQSVDQDRARQVFAELQNEFQGKYVLDLAKLKETARALVPLLESYQETVPYAIWLKTRLDYLDVAEQLRAKAPPPSKPKPGQPTLP